MKRAVELRMNSFYTVSIRAIFFKEIFMNRDMFKRHYPAFAMGFVGALVCQVVVVGVVAACYIATPLQAEIQNRFHALIAKEITNSSPTDSAGQHSDVMDVVSAVNPAVVSIVISKDVPKMEKILNQDSQTNPFGIFGFNIPQYQQNGTEEKEIGGGSGFIVSADGYIVTNAHVVSDKEAKYTVLLNDESKHDATVVAADTTLDIAVLKIDATDLPFLEFGDSNMVKAGQSVIAIGNALGQFRNTVSVGVISGLARSITAAGGQGGSELLSDVLQTDAAINPGNSGGPLLDLSGKVIGVNVATSGGGENISFSLPSNTVRATVESIQKNGRVIQPYLGVHFQMISPDLVAANGLTVKQGALVTRGQDTKQLAVVPGSPADKAGIEENDIITEIDGVALDDTHPLNVVIRQKTVGSTITMKVVHDGNEKAVTVALEERPAETQQ